MRTKNMLLGTAAALCASVVPASPVGAAVVFNNGPAAGNSFFCDSQTDNCGGHAPFTVFDSFSLSAATTVNGFTYNIYFGPGSPSDYTGTLWSIWSSNPQTSWAAGPLDHGTLAGTLAVGLAGSELVTITGLDVTLGPGTYWLGTSNFVDNPDDTTTVAYTSDSSGSQAISTSNGTDWDGLPSLAFTVEGTASTAPEPASLLLMAAGLVVLGFLRYRRKAY